MPMEPVPIPPAAPEPDVDHPDLYIPEAVKLFIPYFQRQISEKVWMHYRGDMQLGNHMWLCHIEWC